MSFLYYLFIGTLFLIWVGLVITAGIYLILHLPYVAVGLMVVGMVAGLGHMIVHD